MWYVDKKQMLFISHSTEDGPIASSLVTMLRTLGFNKKYLFCCSVPGYDILEGEDIYGTLVVLFAQAYYTRDKGNCQPKKDGCGIG